MQRELPSMTTFKILGPVQGQVFSPQKQVERTTVEQGQQTTLFAAEWELHDPLIPSQEDLSVGSIEPNFHQAPVHKLIAM
jgi:hypothetical protein